MTSEDWDPFAHPATGEVLDERPADETAEEAPAGPPLYFSSLDRFVSEYLAMIYRRDPSVASVRWCPEWFKHAEAIARLEAMWRAWELLRLDPGEGASNWWLVHCDPHMRVLLSESGPFRNCRNTSHSEERSQPLPVVAPPRGVFSSNG